MPAHLRDVQCRVVRQIAGILDLPDPNKVSMKKKRKEKRERGGRWMGLYIRGGGWCARGASAAFGCGWDLGGNCGGYLGRLREVGDGT